MVPTRNAPVSREAERAVAARKQGALEIVRETVKDVGETDVPGLAAGRDDARGRGSAELVMTAVVWPAALLVVALAAAILYWKGPDRDEPFRWVTPGAVLFAAGWVAASIAASIYLSQAEPANRTYGLIAAVIAAIVWLYWSNLLFLAGAVLNARVEDARTSRSSEQRTEQSARAQP